MNLKNTVPRAFSAIAFCQAMGIYLGIRFSSRLGKGISSQGSQPRKVTKFT